MASVVGALLLWLFVAGYNLGFHEPKIQWVKELWVLALLTSMPILAKLFLLPPTRSLGLGLTSIALIAIWFGSIPFLGWALKEGRDAKAEKSWKSFGDYLHNNPF